MILKYVVASCHEMTVAVPATTEDGTQITGQMPALLVELIPQNGVGATLSPTILIPTPEQREIALARFAIGNVIIPSWSGE